MCVCCVWGATPGALSPRCRRRGLPFGPKFAPPSPATLRSKLGLRRQSSLLARILASPMFRGPEPIRRIGSRAACSPKSVRNETPDDRSLASSRGPPHRHLSPEHTQAQGSDLDRDRRALHDEARATGGGAGPDAGPQSSPVRLGRARRRLGPPSGAGGGGAERRTPRLSPVSARAAWTLAPVAPILVKVLALTAQINKNDSGPPPCGAPGSIVDTLFGATPCGHPSRAARRGSRARPPLCQRRRWCTTAWCSRTSGTRPRRSGSSSPSSCR